VSNYISQPPYHREWIKFKNKVIHNRPWIVRDFSMHDKGFCEKVAQRWAWNEIIRRRKLYPNKDIYSILEETSLDFYNLWRGSKVKNDTVRFQYGVANDFLIYLIDEVV
jgi:hypothetical protein